MTSKIYKIAVVVPKYGLVGGGEKFVLELTERIALNDRYDVHIFANKWRPQSDRITFHKVPVISFPKFLTTISFAWLANRKIAKMNFDIYGTSWVEKSLIKKGECRMFLPVSGIAKEKFLQEFRVDPEKVQVVHPGVDIDKFNKLDRNICRRKIRKRFGIDETDTVVLFVSMNFELKGLDNLMAAMAMTKSEYPLEKLKLLVVGKGNEKKYGRLAQKLGIKDDVIFAGLWKDNIEQIYLEMGLMDLLSTGKILI
jgi:UDP-glucose:(heptosyl)LPS alpha-1,3-glucosyltransferase